jgi:hypothetical protein
MFGRVNNDIRIMIRVSWDVAVGSMMLRDVL